MVLLGRKFTCTEWCWIGATHVCLHTSRLGWLHTHECSTYIQSQKKYPSADNYYVTMKKRGRSSTCVQDRYFYHYKGPKHHLVCKRAYTDTKWQPGFSLSLAYGTVDWSQLPSKDNETMRENILHNCGARDDVCAVCEWPHCWHFLY